MTGKTILAIATATLALSSISAAETAKPKKSRVCNFEECVNKGVVKMGSDREVAIRWCSKPENIAKTSCS